MPIPAADLRPLKTKDDKMLQARDFDLGIGVGDKEATRRVQAPSKPLGQVSLYRQYFGSYFFWMVTGRGVSQAGAGTATEYYGPSKAKLGPDGIIHWIKELLNADKDEVDFNPYGYLHGVLQEQAKYQGTDAPNLAEVTSWLLAQAEQADVYASLFCPLRYNVRTLVDASWRKLNSEANLTKSLTPNEEERYHYYQRIVSKIDELRNQQLDICELQRNQKRELTADEEDKLAQKDKQVDYLILSHINQLDYNRLRAKYNRKHDAEEYEKGIRYRLLQPLSTEFTEVFNNASSFQPKPDKETGIVPKRIILNLHELKHEFDTNLAFCSTTGSREDYVDDQLRRFDDNRPLIISHFDPYLELDELKITAINNALKDLRIAYVEHQQRMLRASEPIAEESEKPRNADTKATMPKQQEQQGNEGIKQIPVVPFDDEKQLPAEQMGKTKAVENFSPFAEAKKLGFTEEMADRIAIEIELIDEDRNYRSDNGNGGKKPARLCGFYSELKAKKKIIGNLEQLRDYFFWRYLKEQSKTKPDTASKTARKTATKTATALEAICS